jgi:adenylate kinase family enzyme
LRYIVTGEPRSGKTTFSEVLRGHLGIVPRHTDSAFRLSRGPEWRLRGFSEHVAQWIDEPGPWVIEGVAAMRALERWLGRSPGAPCEVLWYLRSDGPARPESRRKDLSDTSPEHLQGIWELVEPELRARGVRILLVPELPA